MITTTENPQVKQHVHVEPVVSNKPDFGKGRYSGEMERIYDAIIAHFGIDPKKAEKIARQAGSDAGAAFRNVSATIKITTATGKDKTMTISDASKAKGITVTNPLALVRAIQWIDDAGKNFISYGHTKWVLSSELQQWITEMTV